MVDSELVEMIELADLMKEGLPPVGGGTLDQSAWFLDAASFHWSEVNRVQVEAMKD